MKKFFPLSTKISDVIVAIYIAITLFARFMLEPQLQGNVFISLMLGGFALLFLWALIKSKIINPTFFGLKPAKQ